VLECLLMKMVMIVLNTNDNYWMSIFEDMNHSKIKYSLQSHTQE
jgi:hypothetical protein